MTCTVKACPRRAVTIFTLPNGTEGRECAKHAGHPRKDNDHG